MPAATELPIDILGEIFIVHVKDEQDARCERVARCESCKPLRAGRMLSQVCRRWRCAALSTPSMWRFIHIDLKAPFQVAPSRDITRSLLNWSLKQSGACPLQLSFANLGSENALEFVKSLVGSESEVAARIERLEIGLAGASFLPFLSILQQVDVPNLKDLVLYHTGYFTVHEVIPPEVFATLEHTPNLHRLSLGRIQWSATDVCLSRITTLSIDLAHEHETLLLRTLNSFPNLVDLILQCTDNVKLTDSWEPIPEAVLPSLKRISFDPRICQYSLHKLDAPKLTTITARNFSRLSPRFLACLPHQTAYSTLRLERFNPEDDWRLEQSATSHWGYKPLESLRVEWTSSFAAGVPGFVACLRNHPEISTLELTNCTIDNEYLYGLATDASLLPNLSQLRLSKCPHITESLLDMVASSRRPLSIFTTL